MTEYKLLYSAIYIYHLHLSLFSFNIKTTPDDYHLTAITLILNNIHIVQLYIKFEVLGKTRA